MHPPQPGNGGTNQWRLNSNVYQDNRVSSANTQCAYASPGGGPGCAAESNPTCDYVALILLAGSQPLSNSDFQSPANFPSGWLIQRVSGIGDRALLGLTNHAAGLQFTHGNLLVVLVAARPCGVVPKWSRP